MSNKEFEKQRRRLLTVIGSSAALLPLASLTACSDDKAPPASPAAEPAAAETTVEPAADETPTQPAAAPDASALPELTEDDPLAESLSYVEDATTVDAAKQPRYAAGQACDNCALYIAVAGSARGACSIFPGKSVNSAGWCSVYAPKG